jgi:uncharacterized coiled-coil DUF342 family protein
MSDELKSCPLCGGEGKKSIRSWLYEPVIACVGEPGCPLHAVLLTETVWQALPRRDEAAAEVAREMQDAEAQLLDDDAVPGPAVLDWAARLRQCAEPGHVPAEVWLSGPGADAVDVHASLGDATGSRAYVKRVPVHGALSPVCDECGELHLSSGAGGYVASWCGCTPVVEAREPGRRDCDECCPDLPEKSDPHEMDDFGRPADEKCERCETPLADTTHCSTCVEELDSVVVRLRRERDEAQKSVEDLQLRVQAMRQDREDAAKERDEILAEFNQRNEQLEKAKERYKAGTQKKCERCGVPVTYTATCSSCVDELSVAVARLRVERDEARAAHAAKGTVKEITVFVPHDIDDGHPIAFVNECEAEAEQENTGGTLYRQIQVKGTTKEGCKVAKEAGYDIAHLRSELDEAHQDLIECRKARLDRSKKTRRYLRACKRMHEEWKKLHKDYKLIREHADKQRKSLNRVKRKYKKARKERKSTTPKEATLDRPKWTRDEDGTLRADWQNLELLVWQSARGGLFEWELTKDSTGEEIGGHSNSEIHAKWCVEGAARDYLDSKGVKPKVITCEQRLESAKQYKNLVDDFAARTSIASLIGAVEALKEGFSRNG